MRQSISVPSTLETLEFGITQSRTLRSRDPEPSNSTWRIDVKKIKFTCSNCEAKLRVPTHLAGVSAPCPKCGSTITAPTDLENIVDDSIEDSSAQSAPNPQREPAVASSTVPESGPASSGNQASVAAPPAGPTISVKVSSGSAVVGSVVSTPVNEATPQAAAAPGVPETEPKIPAAPQVLVEVPPADVPVGEETLVIDSPASEVPEPSVNEVPVETPIPSPPAPVPIATPPAVAAPYADEAPVETELDPPPAVPETQPIQVNPQPSHLPPIRSQEVDSTGELPRLDINLADQGSAAPDSFDQNSGAPTGLTRVQLPQPGTEIESFSPDDFIIPAQSEVVAEEPPAPVEEVVAPEYTELEYAAPEGFPQDAGIPLDEVEAPSVEQPHVHEALDVPQGGSGEYVPLELPPLDSQEPEVAEPEVAELEIAEPALESNFITEAAAAQEMVPAVGEEMAAPAMAEADLHEGSVKNMLSEQGGAPATEPSYEHMETAPIAPSGESQPTTELPAQAPPAEQATLAGATEQVKSERDILDEMFGSAPKEEGTRNATKIMISVMVAVALLAIGFVCVGIWVFGGGMNPSHGQGESPAAPAATNSKSGAKAAAEKSNLNNAAIPEPSIDDAPAVIDPVAQERVEDTNSSASTVTLPGAMDQPVRIVDSSGSASRPADMTAIQAVESSIGNDPPLISDQPALTIDERVQQIVNGENGGTGATLIGGAGNPPPDPTESALADFGSNADEKGRDKIGTLANDAAARITGEKPEGAQIAVPVENYNPPASFPAPEEGLGRTHDLLDAFLRAPDWETRVKYVYRGESLRPAMEEYYKKYDMVNYSRYSKLLFQMEADKELGGPYWVYLISTSDTEQGFPLIIREEDGLLKVDWESFSEFEDRHFVQFQRGAIASPRTFRLVVERVSDYYGSDRNGFETLDDYYVYQVNPPYGDLNEFSDYAFVKMDSEIAKRLDEVVGLGEQPLAVIVTISQEAFSHGVKHLVITDYVTEGWFR